MILLLLNPTTAKKPVIFDPEVVCSKIIASVRNGTPALQSVECRYSTTQAECMDDCTGVNDHYIHS